MIRPFQSVRFDAPKKGTNLLVLGAVHGDEVCGTAAIDALVPEIAQGTLPLLAGSVTFVPICNPLAYARGCRFIDHNLNRDLRPRENPMDYEDSLANLLCPLLEACDVLLDCHSYHAQGPAFIFAGQETEEERAFRRALGPGIELFGWTAAYARLTGREQDNTAIGTTEYMRCFGGMGVTIECGSHQDPQSTPTAHRAIRQAMAFCGVSEREAGEPESFPLNVRVRLETIFTQKDQGRLAKPWRHLEPVQKGEILATTEDGTAITAPDNGYIIFPREFCPIGEEWFYFGVGAANK